MNSVEHRNNLIKYFRAWNPCNRSWYECNCSLSSSSTPVIDGGSSYLEEKLSPKQNMRRINSKEIFFDTYHYNVPDINHLHFNNASNCQSSTSLERPFRTVGDDRRCYFSLSPSYSSPNPTGGEWTEKKQNFSPVDFGCECEVYKSINSKVNIVTLDMCTCQMAFSKECDENILTDRFID